MLGRSKSAPMANIPKIRTVTMGWVRCDAGIQTRGLWSYPWIQSDAGRSQSKRPKQKNDCTVRGLAIARDITYDCAYDILKSRERQCAKGFHIGQWLGKQPWAQKISFPAVKGVRRMNIAEFCGQYSTGRYICRVAKHVFAVVNGVVYDTDINRCDRCVYLAWKVEVSKNPF